jgi:hypothetical protein
VYSCASLLEHYRDQNKRLESDCRAMICHWMCRACHKVKNESTPKMRSCKAKQTNVAAALIRGASDAAACKTTELPAHAPARIARAHTRFQTLLCPTGPDTIQMRCWMLPPRCIRKKWASTAHQHNSYPDKATWSLVASCKCETIFAAMDGSTQEAGRAPELQ